MLGDFPNTYSWENGGAGSRIKFILAPFLDYE